jgi:pimeloyl-ACP methyl ester carboxylesterase
VLEPFDEPPPGSEWMEEDGQRVRWDFWREAWAVDFLGAYARLQGRCMMIFGTADEFTPATSVRTVQRAQRHGDAIRVVEGLPHSAWPEPLRSSLLAETLDWLEGVLTAER